MNFYSKKGIYTIIGLFVIWTIISSFWYTCGIKGFCKEELKIEEKKEELVKNQISEIPINETPKTTIECDTYLKKDLTKDEIKKLQFFLNEFEGENLIVDGIYGPSTKVAVENFQQKNYPDISFSDGKVGEDTRYEINKDYCIYEFNKINNN